MLTLTEPVTNYTVFYYLLADPGDLRTVLLEFFDFYLKFLLYRPYNLQ